MQISRGRFLTVTFSIFVIAVLLTTYVFASVTSNTMYLEQGIYPAAPNHTIWRVGSTYYSKDVNGQLSTPSSNASLVFLNTISAGNSIFFASGEFIFDTQITLASNMRIYANSYTTTLKVADSSNWGVGIGLLQGIDLDNVAISGLVLDGNRANQDTSGFARNIILVNSTNILIENCKVINAVFAGVDLRGVNGALMSNTIASFNGKAGNPVSLGVGIYIRNSGAADSNNITLSNVIANDNGDTSSGDGSGIDVFGQGSVSITNSHTYNNTRYGIKSQCGNLTIVNHHSIANDYGISVSTGFNANSTQILGGEMLYNDIYGIYITAPATIIGTEVGWTGGDGIRAEAASPFQGIIIVGVNSHENAQNGINIKGVNYTTISACNVWNNTQNGVQFDDFDANSNGTFWSIVSGLVSWGNGAFGFREANAANVDYNMVIGSNVEGNTFDGYPLTGANSRIFSSWNGTHWQNDAP